MLTVKPVYLPTIAIVTILSLSCTSLHLATRLYQFCIGPVSMSLPIAELGFAKCNLSRRKLPRFLIKNYLKVTTDKYLLEQKQWHFERIGNIVYIYHMGGKEVTEQRYLKL